MNKLRNLFIYQVFVRNYSNKGTLNEVTKDLNRIKDLGADIVYLMPIQPIGVKGRKGNYGSPYAISNYTEISPDLGSMDDLKKLIQESHKIGLKVIMDIVFHHSAPDHVWTLQHPDYYVYKNGKLSNKVGEWSDIADFEFDNNPALIESLTQVLEFYVDLGLDGFRFDVASLIPHSFYQVAFPRIRAKNSQLILLAESVHLRFVDYLRFHGHNCLSDAELYQYFDILYDYDAHDPYANYLRQNTDLEAMREIMRMQEHIYPANYTKARNIENHDQPRNRYYTQSDEKTKQWIGYVFFAKGAAFLNNGIETGNDHINKLFEKDPINFKHIKKDWVELIQKCALLKKDPIMAQDSGYKIVSHKEDVLHFEYHSDQEIRVGLFNVGALRGVLEVDLPEGVYTNLIDGKNIEIRFQTIPLMDVPLIFSIDLTNKQEANH